MHHTPAPIMKEEAQVQSPKVCHPKIRERNEEEALIQPQKKNLLFTHRWPNPEVFGETCKAPELQQKWKPRQAHGTCGRSTRLLSR